MKDLTPLTGNDTKPIGKAFSDFIQQQKLKQDIDISITQLDDGKNHGVKTYISHLISNESRELAI